VFKQKLYQLIFIVLRKINYLLFPIPACRFTPTCSRYAEECFQKFGIATALFLSIKRVLRCHPWHEGGLDPVPEKLQKRQKK
jgi:putative membrane protein insertion efficiency factor